MNSAPSTLITSLRPAKVWLLNAVLVNSIEPLGCVRRRPPPSDVASAQLSLASKSARDNEVASPSAAGDDEPTYKSVALGKWMEHLNSADKLTRRNAAEALGRIGPKARAAVPALCERVRKDSDKYVRIAAAEALGNVGHDEADAVKALARQCEVVIVVGSPNSSNSNRLREVAEQQGVAAWMVDRPEELRPEWVAGKRVVGVTAGASAPEVLVQQVVERLRALGAQRVTSLQGIEENVTFSLPRALSVARAVASD